MLYCVLQLCTFMCPDCTCEQFVPFGLKLDLGVGFVWFLHIYLLLMPFVCVKSWVFVFF